MKKTFAKSLLDVSQYHSWGIIEMLNHTALFTAIRSMIQAYLKLFQCIISPLQKFAFLNHLRFRWGFWKLGFFVNLSI